MHFQGLCPSLYLYFVRLNPLDAFSYSRSRDFEDSEGSALGKAMSSDPWYKDIVPNVRGPTMISI